MTTSLGSRLRWWYVLAITVTVALALLVGRLFLERQLIQSIDLLNAVEFQEIRDRVIQGKTALSEQELLKTISAHAELDSLLYFFQVRRLGGGPILFQSSNMKGHALPPPPAAGASGNYTCWAGPLREVRVSDFTLGQYEMQIGTPLNNVRRMFGSYSRMSFGVMGFVLVLSVFVGQWGSHVALGPIRRIQQTAARISADNLSERIPEGQAQDEVAGLAQLLNRMFDRLEVSFGKVWRFAADASHELRTPLSLIRLQSEKLLTRGQLTEPQIEAIHQQLEAIGRLDSVIEKLLFLAKAGAGSIPVQLMRQNAYEMIDAFVPDALVLCEEHGVHFQVHLNAAATVEIDHILLRQVLLNLVNNALQVLPEGGEILLSSAPAGTVWRVSVEDNGPGVPRDQLQAIFEPFMRAPAAPLREKTAGSGLGLAICRNIVELHRGRIYAENRHPGSGLRVTFEISLRPASPLDPAHVLPLAG